MARKVKYTTGFCQVGFHEGTKAKGASGKPVMTCASVDICHCKCHATITAMFEQAGLPRVVQVNPEYQVDRSRYVMPDPVEVEAQRAANRLPSPDAQVKVALPRNPLEVTTAPTYNETPTGKRARGQLEAQVLAVCSAFTRGLIEEEFLTPVVIGNEIDEVEPPSAGAIGAIFNRWVEIGFAVCEKGPVRFVAFTPDGVIKGLEALRIEHKSKARLKEANDGRQLRPRR